MSRFVILVFLCLTCLATGFAQWTRWYNRDRPSGNCDCECIECYAQGTAPCSQPGMKSGRAECRRLRTGQVFTEATAHLMPNMFRRPCRANGLMCFNIDNARRGKPRCEDYAIRHFCVPKDTTTTRTTTTTTRSTTTRTTIPPPQTKCHCYSCGSGWISSGDRCFIAIGCGNVPCSHKDARRRCAAMGGRQARVLSLEDNEFFSSIIAPSVVRVLVAGSDEKTEGTWLFQNSSALVYTNWLNGQPNDAFSDEDCLAIMVKQLTKWDDVPCCKTFGAETVFVCEKNACCLDKIEMVH